MRKRTGLVLAVALAGALVLTALASYGTAALGKKGELKAKKMSGYLEVPSVSTTARGTIEVKINNNSTIEYKLTYSGLSGNPAQAHIHLGQPSANGGVVAFLCGGGGKSACPASTSGTVSGTIVAADIQALAAQGIAGPADFGEVTAAMKAGFTYANVHTASFTGGELRGQVRARGNNGDDD
ncbi:MAG TPA: CHRD domain-containing protein [Gaiellaceae bacterium]|jgi:hypothetical protein|nr:CHRD domain-containing protein [Gaiellaceae bacterium]